MIACGVASWLYRRVKIVAAAILLLAWLMPTHASAVSAEQRCETTKLRAAGAELQQRLICEALGLATGADPACIARAAKRRDDTFRRADTNGGCATIGDSDDVGALVAFRVELVREGLLTRGPAASACTKRELLVSSWSAAKLSTIYANAGRVRHEALLVAARAHIRAAAEAAYRVALSKGDCLNPEPPDQIHSGLEATIASLRDATCPMCGVFCPCWTTAQLDDWFPPGAFKAMGGTGCGLISLGYIEAINSKQFCRVPRPPYGATPDLSFFRAGFVLFFGEQCWVARDIDHDADGLCNGFPAMFDVTPAQLSVCFDDMKASRIYRAECHVPS
jgi:hypothetical protein